MSHRTCSTAISSNGFIECFTPAVSTPRLSARTRICVERSVASWTKAEWFYQASGCNYKFRCTSLEKTFDAKETGCIRAESMDAAANKCQEAARGYRQGHRSMIRARTGGDGFLPPLRGGVASSLTGRAASHWHVQGMPVTMVVKMEGTQQQAFL